MPVNMVIAVAGQAPMDVKTSGQSLIGRTVVQVADQDVDAVQVPLSEGAVVTGTVRIAGDDPGKPSPWPSLALAPAESQMEEEMAAEVRPDGKFRIDHILPSRYSVRVSGLSDDLYVKAIRFEGRDITGEDLNLSSGVGGTLEVLLSPGAAAISGVVRGAGGEAAAGATVQVCLGDDTVKYVRSDENGEYTVGGLAPGDYRVLAWEEVDAGLALDPAFRARFDAQTASVKAAAAGHSSAEVKLIAREAIESEAAKLK